MFDQLLSIGVCSAGAPKQDLYKGEKAPDVPSDAYLSLRFAALLPLDSSSQVGQGSIWAIWIHLV